MDLVNIFALLVYIQITNVQGSGQILVIGGYCRSCVGLKGYRYQQKQTDVIDLTDPSLICTSVFGELESVRENSIGGLINETPILCGGRNSKDSCIVFGQTKTSIKLNEPRSHAASVVLNETTLWIMGGSVPFPGTALSSTELITLDPATSVNGPALPNELYSSCAVKYNDTHIYLTGGLDASDWTNKVWIYNTILDAGSSSWTEGPRMNNKRGTHGCTVLHHGQSSWIVVAGGYDGKKPVKRMEILDPNKKKWVQGPDLPYGLVNLHQAMVTSPDGMGIIIVGGLNLDSLSTEKKILESRFDGSKFLPWKVMDHELKYGRDNHVVIPIPNSITNCT